IKCSVYYMGIVNDVDALAHSSNTYQFNTAIKVGNGNYKYNQPLKIDTKAFEIYRNTFAEFGLGVKTGIDLPVESLGYKGVSKLPGYLLDFAIGQYDTYTPIQLSQYVSTIANNGIRTKPKLLKAVYSSNSEEPLTNLIYKNKAVIINTLNTESEYLRRVRLGFQSVIAYGTGYGYIDSHNLAAGKTGTSESFIDTDNDGIVDTETISNAFVAYAPYNNPKVAFTVVSPDVAPAGVGYSYRSNVNKRITQRITKKYFQMYK
ncbi:MAG: penicillin-binding transpeptidase domain-containing protein, partial [Clostridia bacterium]|nr:penicillin-binding transpeptidase domain-containing protein [Clostridia bacterium]